MISSRVIGVIAFMAVMGTAAEAEGYCVIDGDIAQFWGVSFPDLHIPVWVTRGGANSVAWTGVDPEDVARLTIEVIARHNETAGFPKLYFAGFTDAAYDWNAESAIDELETGISIMGMSCDDVNYDDCGNQDAVACANIGYRSQASDAIGWMRFLPPGCSAAAPWSIVEYNDMAQVMLHEFGHTLGLWHADVTQDACESMGGRHVGEPEGTGVMISVVPAGFAALRSWRRADLDALGQLYGAASPEYELAWWHDDAYPQYPLDATGESLVGMAVSRGASVSNQGDSGTQVVATTGVDGRVLHRIIDAAGEVSPPVGDAPVDASPSGIAWSPPAAALGRVDGQPRVFVAWWADESPQSTLATLRMATRPLDSLEWSRANHGVQHRVNRVALGFDETAERVVAATMHTYTSELTLVAFDGGGQPMGPFMVVSGVAAFDVGTPVCDDSRCLVPYSQPVFGGPNFAIAEVDVDVQSSTATLIDTEILAAVDTFGRLTMIEDLEGLWVTTGERRFSLGGYPNSDPDAGAFVWNPARDWPIAALRWNDGSTPSLMQPRAVRCGNGIVQANEICDDGNLVLGDGCDLCGVDGTDDTGGSDTGTPTDTGTETGICDDDETGPSSDTQAGSGDATDEVGIDGGDPAAEGCECGTSTQGPASLLGLVALAALRRRPRPLVIRG